MRTTLYLTAGLLTLYLTAAGRGADWPQFRGPNGSATTAGTGLPVEWGADKNVAWKAEVPGYGWSSPIIWGDKVFVTTAVSDKQTKPSGGFGGGGPGGFGRGQRPPDAVYKWEVYCLSAADGKVIWKQTAAEHKPTIPKFPSNTYASETPVTDGERVVAYFGMTGVFCYDFAGKLLWKKDLGSYPMMFGHGTGSSPALDGGRVFIQCDNEEKSFLVALDVKTGDELWRVARTERTGWSTPLVWKNKERTEVVCVGSPKARSYDPATGKQLWELGGLGGQVKASPAADRELLYVGTGGFGAFGEGGPGGFGAFSAPPQAGQVLPPALQDTLKLTDEQKKQLEELQKEVDAKVEKILTDEQRKQLKDMQGGGGGRGGRGGFGGRGGGAGGFGGGRPLFAVKAGASGDITLKDGAKSNDGVAWSLPNAGPATPSPLLYDGHLYVLEERGGLVSCYDAKTGKQVYKERLPGARGFTSSPVACDGKVFCLDDAGTTYVLQAGPQFKVLGKNALGEMCWSSAAVGGGAVFVRTVEHLYCLKDRGGEK
jgi:outer membrane protein assembly factor BamB